MAKKSAIRRLSKRLPLNTDLDDLIRRDDALYDFESKAAPQIAQIHTLAGRLDHLAALPSSASSQIDAATGEVTTTTNDMRGNENFGRTESASKEYQDKVTGTAGTKNTT